MQGISQEQLASLLGLTFQQIQKYERGSNRMSASRLFQIAHVLDIPVAWFFAQIEPGRGGVRPAGPGLTEDDAVALTKRETLELVRIYYQIQDPKLRRKLFQVAQALAEE